MLRWMQVAFVQPRMSALWEVYFTASNPLSNGGWAATINIKLGCRVLAGHARFQANSLSNLVRNHTPEISPSNDRPEQ